MIKLKYLFLFVLLHTAVFAQEKISLTSSEMDTRFYEKDKIPIVTGQLLNYAPTDLRNVAVKYQITAPTVENETTKIARIQPDGTFQIKLNHSFPYQQITLEVEGYYKGEIIANEGLSIELDILQLKLNPVQNLGKGVQFTGKDAGINVYFNRFNNFKNKEKGAFYIAKQTVIMNNQLGTNQQLIQYEEVYKIWDKIVADYIAEYPSEYEWLLKNERDSDYYAWLFTLFWQKEIPQDLLKAALNHQPFLVSNIGMTYYKYLCRLMKLIPSDRNYELTKKILEERVIGEQNLADLAKFLEQYQLRLNRKKFDEVIFQNWGYRFLTTNREVLRTARLDEFSINLASLDTKLADVLKLFGAPTNKWQRKQYYKKFLPQTATNWVSTFMIDEVGIIETYTSSIQQTLPAPSILTTNAILGLPLKTLSFEADLYLGQATEAKTFVAAIQNAFPNQALILDVWATWCRPCIVDMERSKPTKKALKELPLEIIYLAVADGSSQQKWEETINQLEVSGNHIYIEKDLADSLLKYFNLFGYPSYIFIDKNGNWDAGLVRSISNLDKDRLMGRL